MISRFEFIWFVYIPPYLHCGIVSLFIFLEKTKQKSVVALESLLLSRAFATTRHALRDWWSNCLRIGWAIAHLFYAFYAFSQTVPSAVSIIEIPIAMSSSRMASERAKFFSFFACVLSEISVSIFAFSSSEIPI